MSDFKAPRSAVDIWLEEKTEDIMSRVKMPDERWQHAMRLLLQSTLGMAYWKGKRDGIDACEAILDKHLPK